MGEVTAKAAAATPAVRAKALPALAKLPKDTGDFIVLTESAAPMLQSFFPPETPSSLPTSAAVASSAKNAPLYGAIGKLAVLCSIGDYMKTVLSGLPAKDGAALEADGHLNKLATAMDKEAAEVAKAIAGKKLHPLYIVTTFTEAPHVGSEPEDGMTLADLLQDVKVLVEAGTKTHPGMDALMAEAAKHQFSVKGTAEGTTRIIYICEKGVEPKFAAKPEASVLSAPQMTCTDAGIGGTMLAAGYVSPELQTALGKSCILYQALSSHRTAAIMGLSKETRGAVASADKAAAATQRWLKAFIGPDAKKPGSFQVWTDKKGGAYHVAIDMDARGCSYTGSLTHTKPADAKNTFLYIESTGLKRPQELPDIGTLLEPYAELVMQGYSAATAEVVDEDGESVEMTAPAMDGPMMMFASALPLLGDLGAIGKGMGDGFAIIGDFAPKGKEKKELFPRLGYSCTVSDMAQVSKGWEQLAGHATPLLGELKTTSKAGKNGETCHRLKLPTNEGDFVPNALTDGKALAFGSSIKLNKTLLAASRSQGAPFQGAVFMLNVGTLRKGLKAASSAPDSIIPPVGDEIPGAVKSVFGSSTISNGVHTIRLDINMK